MNASEVIVELLKDNKKSQIWLAEKLGYARASSINNMIANGNVEINTLIRICDAMEYEITIQPKRKAGARPNGQLVIDTVSKADSGKKRGKKRKEDVEGK